MIELSYAIIKRIRDNIAGFKTVENPANIMYALEQGQEITPFLPGCFVLAGRGEPVINSTANNARLPARFPFVEEQTYGVHILVPHNLDDTDNTLTDLNASKFIVQIIKLLHAWQPDGAGQAQKESFKLVYTGREEAEYSGSYGVYPLTFTAHRSITDAENP